MEQPSAGADPAKSRGHRPVLRSAVVGSGGISKEHLGFLSGQSHLGAATATDIDLVGVCDLSPITARYARDTYQAGAAFTNLTTMLAETRPDVVHILTPPGSHVGLSTQCLEAGSHVICEKPITATSGELDNLLSVAERAGRHIMESHNYRFNPGVEALIDTIADGRLGSIREVEVRIALPVTDPGGRFGDPNLPSPIHSMPAGVIHDFTTHFAYLLLALTGPVTFDRVAAAWNNHGDNPLFRYDNLDAVMIGSGSDGPVHARLRFDAEAGPDMFSLRVFGTEGWAETDLFQPNLRLVVPRPGGAQLTSIVNHVANGVGLVGSGVTNLGRKIMQQTPYEGLHRMLGLAYDALALGQALPVTPDDMLAASRLVDLILDEKHRL